MRILSMPFLLPITTTVLLLPAGCGPSPDGEPTAPVTSPTPGTGSPEPVSPSPSPESPTPALPASPPPVSPTPPVSPGATATPMVEPSPTPPAAPTPESTPEWVSTPSPAPAATPTPVQAVSPTPPHLASPTPLPTPLPAVPPVLLEDTTNPIPLTKRFEVQLDHSAPIRLTCDEQGGGQERHRIRAEGGDRYALSLRGLKPDTGYTCVVESLDGSGLASSPVQVATDPLPSDLEPPVLMVQDAPREDIGYALFNYSYDIGGWEYESRYLVILDADGNVRWYLPGIGGGTIDTTYLGDNRIIYGGYAFGETLPTIMDLDWVVYFVDQSGPQTPHGWVGSYHHDVGLSLEGDAIFALMTIIMDDTYQGYTVRHVDLDSNLLWEWDSGVDGLDAGYLPPGDGTTGDPYHANSAQDVWENGRRYVYVGMRHLSEIIKIDYETKAVAWKLGVDGDFALLEPDGTPGEDHRWFFMQHDAKRYGDRMVIYDNGLLRREYGGAYNYSRALELELDEQAMTARITFEYDEADEGWLEEAWGGCDLLDNDNYFVAMGHCWGCNNDVHLSALVEVDPQGRQVSRLEWTNPQVALYRADRIDGCAIFNNVTYCPDVE